MTILVLDQPLIWTGQGRSWPPTPGGPGSAPDYDLSPQTLAQQLGAEYWFDMNLFDFDDFIEGLVVTYHFDAEDLALDSLASTYESTFWIDTKDLT